MKLNLNILVIILIINIFLLVDILSLKSMFNSSFKFDKSMFGNNKSELKQLVFNLNNTKNLKVLTNNSNNNKNVNDYNSYYINENYFNREKSKADVYYGSITYNTKSNELIYYNKYILNNDITNTNEIIVSRGVYTKSLKQIGWSRLHIESIINEENLKNNLYIVPYEIVSYSLGYIEGKLTANSIYEFYQNLIGLHSDEGKELNEVFNYYSEVEESIRKKTSKDYLNTLSNEADLEYWISVAMVQAQTDGLYNGYNSVMKSLGYELSFDKFYFINADGEVPELLTVFKNNNYINNTNVNENLKNNTKSPLNFSFKEKLNNKKNIEKFSPEYLKMHFNTSDPTLVWNKLVTKSHCTAVVKAVFNVDNEKTTNKSILENKLSNKKKLKDMFVAHTTWDSFSEMHRIFKVYDISFTLFNKQKKSHIMFSSYPGTITSTDDYYLINSKISVLETTIEILDRELYSLVDVSPKNHVPNYIRIFIANLMADSGKQWVDIFKRNNTGTYNSQWMIIDYSIIDKFRKSKDNVRYSNSSVLKFNDYYKNMFSSFKENELKNNNNNNNKEFNLNHLRFKSINKSNLIKKENKLTKNYRSFRLKSIKDISFINNKLSNSQKLDFNENYKGLFYIVEQIPGLIKEEDVTNVFLNEGYWASYNRPYIKEIYIKAGYTEMAKRYGTLYSYKYNQRAEIIKNKIDKLNSVDDLKLLMQSSRDNNNNISTNAVSPRFDLILDQSNRKASGGIDSKITSYLMSKSNIILAISGPASTDNNSYFNWSNFKDEPHYGLPEEYNFSWVKFDDNFIENSNILP